MKEIIHAVTIHASPQSVYDALTTEEPQAALRDRLRNTVRAAGVKPGLDLTKSVDQVIMSV